MGRLLSGVSHGLTSSKERLHDGHVSQWGAAKSGGADGCGVGAMTPRRVENLGGNAQRFGMKWVHPSKIETSVFDLCCFLASFREKIFNTPKSVC